MRIIASIIALAASVMSSSCSAEQAFKAPGAGRWYPAGRKELTEMVDGFLAEAPDAAGKGRPIAIISPHAGYAYSGKCAGAAFAAVKGLAYERVIVLGLSHGVAFRGIAVLKADSYVTPLGGVRIDRATCDRLLEQKDVYVDMPAAFSPEHSLDNQIPFLQRALDGDFKLVPILIGQADGDLMKAAAASLRPMLADGKTLLVVSSDFTHYGRDYGYVPFKDNPKERLKKLAMDAAGAIQKLDFDGFQKHLEITGDTICGRNGISTLLLALPKESVGTLARFYTSADLSGDFSMSVSYLSFVFTHPGIPRALEEKAMMISEDGQKMLLSIARQTIEAAVSGQKAPAVAVDAAELQGQQGAFVTITKNGELRGCIGQFTANEPLHQVVRKMARSSALEDSRFEGNRLKPADLADAKIEISVLSPMKRVKDPANEVKLGVHGIYIRRGYRAGTFLPQVATDHNMTLDEFLSTCCSHKAGLPPDAWKDPETEVFVYSAQVFGE